MSESYLGSKKSLIKNTTAFYGTKQPNTSEESCWHIRYCYLQGFLKKVTIHPWSPLINMGCEGCLFWDAFCVFLTISCQDLLIPTVNSPVPLNLHGQNLWRRWKKDKLLHCICVWTCPCSTDSRELITDKRGLRSRGHNDWITRKPLLCCCPLFQSVTWCH